MKKRFLSVALSLCMLMALFPSMATTASANNEFTYSAGDTYTRGSAYEISSAETLKLLSDAVAAGNTMEGVTFYLAGDLNMNPGFTFYSDGGYSGGDTPAVWTTPIGKDTAVFSGTFDGGNHTISGLYIKSSDSTSYVGLFGYVGKDGTVEDLKIDNSCFYVSSGNYKNDGASYVGGIAGENEGTITNCSNTAYIYGNQYVGGIAGGNDGTIANCSNSSSVDGSYRNIGGIAGKCIRGTICNSYNTGEITGGRTTGGIVGYSESSSIYNNYNTGSVSGKYAIGGISGDSVQTTICNNYNTGAIESTYYCTYYGGVGGISGYAEVTTICNNYNTGEVKSSPTYTSHTYAGGIAGYCTKSTIYNNYNAGNVSGKDYVRSLVGYITGSTVRYCYWLKTDTICKYLNPVGNRYCVGCGYVTSADGSINWVDYADPTVVTGDEVKLQEALNAWVKEYKNDSSYDTWTATSENNNGFPVLSAPWTSTLKTVAVKYYSSDGSDLLKSQTVTVGRDSLSNYEPTASNKDFQGWAISSDRNTVKYLPLDTYTSADYASDPINLSELNLYAVWTTAAGAENSKTATVYLDYKDGNYTDVTIDSAAEDAVPGPSGKVDVGAAFTFGTETGQIAALPGASAQLTVYAKDVDAPYEIDTVYLFDETCSVTRVIGKLSGLNEEWNTTVLTVPQSLFVSGHTYQLQISASDGWAVYIRSAYLLLDGGDDAANIKDKSVSVTLDADGHPSATTSLTTASASTYSLEYKLSSVDENGDTVQLGGNGEDEDKNVKTITIQTTADNNLTGTDSITWDTKDNTVTLESGTTYQLDVTINSSAGIPVSTISKTFMVYNYSYNLNGHGSTAPDGGKVMTGEKLTKPADPEAEGYAFGGWYKEPGCENQWDFDTDTVNADITFYALWRTAPTVKTVSVVSGGDSAAVSDQIAITFSEEMDTSSGKVSLSDGSGTTPLSGGVWSDGGKVYTVSYSDLAYATEYTVQISDFKSKSSAAMSADNTHTFTTGSAATISGKTVCGEILTASLADGTPDSYQWTRGGTDIDGATDSTYTLTGDDIGENIAVKIKSGEDTVTSAAVGPVTSVIDAAKEAAESADYSGITQADAADESAVQTAVQNIAEAAVDNSSVTTRVSTVHYTAPEAGTSADPDGTDGSYTFTVTVSDGEGSETTSEITVAIAPTPYAGVTDAEAVAAAENALKDVSDSVNVVEDASQEDKTAAVQSYVDHLLKNTPDASGVTAVVTYNSETEKYDVALSKGGEAGSTTGLGITVNEVPALTGTATITGDAVAGETLTAELTGSTASGTLFYQWTRDGEDITGATSVTYTLTGDDIGKTVAVKITSSDRAGTKTSAPTAAVSKSDYEESVPKPELSSKTKNSATVTARDGYEYIVVAHGADISTGTWQDSNTFTGLASDTSYDIYQRVKETDTHNASAASDGVTFKTNAKPTTCTVTYYWNDGKTTTPYATQSVNKGNGTTDPGTPQRSGYVFAGWYREPVCMNTWNFSLDTVARDTKLYAKWAQTYSVSGTVGDEDSAPVEGAAVKVMQGNTQFGATAHTNETGKFTVAGVPAGDYNLVVTKDGQTVTLYITVKGDYEFPGQITLPVGNKSSELDIVGSDTPNVVENGLNDLFENDTTVYGDGDKDTVGNGGTVKIKLTVQKDDSSEDRNTVIAEMNSVGYKSGIVLDVNMEKTVTDHSGMIQDQTSITELQNPITLIIPLPEEIQGKSNYVVYRIHDYDGTKKTDAITTKKNANDEHIVVSSDRTYVILHAKFFSAYAIGYIESSTSSSNSDSDSDSDSSRSYSVTVSAGQGGSISPSGSVSIEKGTDKTFTFTPDEGYAISDVLIDGKSVGAVSSYTFKNMDTAHTIRAVFVKAEGLPYYLDGNGAKVFIGFASDASGKMKYIVPKGESVLFTPNPKNFADISGHWAKSHIDFVTQRELFVGKDANTFSPDSGMTRAMFAAVIGRLYERSYGPITATGETFSDVPDGKYYKPYVCWAQENGIILGIREDQFAPDRKITREEMAAILYRFAEFMKVSGESSTTELTYPDLEDFHAWAIDAVKYCQQNGIIVGRSDGSFAPKDTATRAEVATILNRFIEVVI